MKKFVVADLIFFPWIELEEFSLSCFNWVLLSSGITTSNTTGSISDFWVSQKLCKTKHAYITLGILSTGMSIGRCKILHLALSFPNAHSVVFRVLLSIWLKTTSSFVEQCSYSFITYGNKGYTESAKNNCVSHNYIQVRFLCKTDWIFLKNNYFVYHNLQKLWHRVHYPTT